MTEIRYEKGMELNHVGARYIKGQCYVDVTEHCYCVGVLNNQKPFGCGIECTEAEAYDWLDEVGE